jgi:SSS family solute:Na+ symporter
LFTLHWLDLTLIAAYLALMVYIGKVLSAKIKNESDYFLAGKSLPWWIIGLSVIGTNIGSNDYLGASGGAYRIGIAQANFEWIGAIPAMIISAFIFIPFYWRAGVYSIPEYLGLRYNQTVRVISAFVLSLFAVLIVGVYHWASALMLETYLGWPMYISIPITAATVGFYTISGGLRADTFTDAIQVTLMFASSIFLAYFGIQKAGGYDAFMNTLSTKFPQHLHAFLPADHPDFPWPGVILGLGFVLSPAYWCANQAILLRTLGARSEWDGRASMIFAALAKTFVPVLIILPGFVALVLLTEKLPVSDAALPWVVKNVLPPGPSGLFFVAFIAALQASVSSALNSTAVMVTRDILGVLHPVKRTDSEVVRMGRISTFGILALGVASAPLTAKFEGIYIFVQTALSLFQGPMFALIIVGILYRKATATAGLCTLVSGLASALVLKVIGLNMLYIAFWTFVLSVCLLLIISAFTRRKTDAELVNLCYFSTVKRHV